MDRRKFIATAGASVATIGLAGCADPEGGTGTEGTGDGGVLEDTTADGGVGETTDGGALEETTTEGGMEDTTTEGGVEETTTEGGTGGTGTGGDFDVADLEGELGENVSQYVEVTSHEGFESGGAVGVRGVVENTADQALELVEVEVTLNDGDTVLGEFVDTTEQEIDSLGAGEQWEWQVTFEEENLTQNTGYTINVDAELADDGTGTGTGTTTNAFSLPW